MFADLETEYPRAWACLQALSDAISAGGGPTRFRVPATPVQPLPESEELVGTRAAGKAWTRVQSGVDPRFDGELISRIRQAASARIPLFVLSLSRISRNTAKLFRTLEMVLARDVTVVTANYFLRNGDAWTRRGPFVAPDSRSPEAAMTTTGLSGAHRKAVKMIAELFAGQ